MDCINNCVVVVSWADLDVGCVNLSQQNLLRFQAAQLAQLFLQAHVLLIHVETQPVPHWSGAVKFDNCKSKKLLCETGVPADGF